MTDTKLKTLKLEGTDEFSTLVSKLRETYSAYAVDVIQDQLFSLGSTVVPALLRLVGNKEESDRVRAALLEVAANLDLAASKTVLIESLSGQSDLLRGVAVDMLEDNENTVERTNNGEKEDGDAAG